MVIKKKEPQTKEDSFILGTNEKCFKTLETGDYSVRFGITNATVKVFYFSKPDNNL